MESRKVVRRDGKIFQAPEKFVNLLKEGSREKIMEMLDGQPGYLILSWSGWTPYLFNCGSWTAKEDDYYNMAHFLEKKIVLIDHRGETRDWPKSDVNLFAVIDAGSWQNYDLLQLEKRFEQAEKCVEQAGEENRNLRIRVEELESAIRRIQGINNRGGEGSRRAVSGIIQKVLTKALAS